MENRLLLIILIACLVLISACTEQARDLMNQTNNEAGGDDSYDGCGNGICDYDETCDSCIADCGLCVVCGDSICDSDETCITCPGDCGICGNDDTGDNDDDTDGDNDDDDIGTGGGTGGGSGSGSGDPAPCTPICTGLECGDDGCSGSCGTCDDSNECTTDSCAGGLCVYTNVTNGTACTGGVCFSGSCVECILDSDCDDSVACTVDTCASNVCVNTPDDNLCGTNEVCVADTGCVYVDPGEPVILSVSAPLEQGQDITITGSGFGVKENVTPMLWDDFEDGVAGENLTDPKVGSWEISHGQTSPWPYFSDGQSHSGSLAMYGSNNRGLSSYIYTRFPQVEGNFIWSFWFWHDHEECTQNCAQNECCGQTKIMQLWGTQPYTRDYDPGVMSGGAAGTWFISYVVTDYGSDNSQESWYTGAPSRGEWHRFDAILKQGGDNVSDGSVELLVDQERIYYKPDIITRDDGQWWDRALFFYGFTNWHTDIFVERYLDDVYFDSSWARIELCDNQTKNLSTQCEIQPPHTTWSDTSIQFTTNLGSFTTEQLYLFVIDEYGTVSNGYPVT
ncbi:hypothetical protein ACFLQN_00565 [Candidatus Aenigmatarchaeota archaeon]